MRTPIPGVRAVIGLVGHARAGKDTVAKMLLRRLPGSERFALSDAVAVEARLHHGMIGRDPEVLQRVGIMFRLARPGVWLEAVYQAIVDKAPDVAIITGIRFADEAEMVRQMGGVVVRIVRVDQDGQRHVSHDRNPAHAAERDIDTVRADYEMSAQSGDVMALERSVEQWLTAVRFAA